MVCSELPTQFLPPSNGGGLLHSLILVFDPLPQIFVHAECELQEPQRPLAAIKILDYNQIFESSTITMQIHFV